MISVSKAREIILSSVGTVDTQNVSLLASLGMVLAEDVQSDIDIPPFDNSAMDGYALISEDVKGASDDEPVSLLVIQDLPAGYVARANVEKGKAIRIMTGAPLPPGADAVVPVELTRAEGERVLVTREVRAEENVRRAGEDIHGGETVLRKGTKVGPAELGMLASLGRAHVAVFRRPVVGIISTGDELIPVEEELQPGKIRDSNSYTLLGLVQETGAVPIRLGIVGDDAELLKNTILDHLDRVDLFITSGGVSVGDYDMVKGVLAELGEVNFWKVAMRPGKPQAFGLIQGKPLFGLPGNPVSVMVSYEQFIRPALLKMMGLNELYRPVVEAEIETPMGRSKGRVEFIRVILREENGVFKARVTGPQGSGILKSMVLGHGLAVLPEEVGRLEPGERVKVQLLKVEPQAWIQV
jgi:molybdopterin molybdotransferase